VKISDLFSPLKGVSIIEKNEESEVKNQDRRSLCHLRVYEQGKKEEKKKINRWRQE
jgi:hypothetical protein